jgi:hypothetical protein
MSRRRVVKTLIINTHYVFFTQDRGLLTPQSPIPQPDSPLFPPIPSSSQLIESKPFESDDEDQDIKPAPVTFYSASSSALFSSSTSSTETRIKRSLTEDKSSASGSSP